MNMQESNSEKNNKEHNGMIRLSVGRISQANKEVIDPAVLAAPLANCQGIPPSAAIYWCNDPLQQRRSTLNGSVMQPLAWVGSSATGFNTPDVGSVAMTDAVGAVQSLGEVRFNDPTALAVCPTPPLVFNKSDAEIRLQELEEVARSFGVTIPR
jgi:hypothetical protein